MAFILSGSLENGDAGFSIAKAQRFCQTAKGYPVTLYNTLAESPVSIFVHGNSGGVGDYDSAAQAYKIPILACCKLSNIFDGIWRRGNNSGTTVANRLCNQNAIYVEAGKTYTVKHTSEKRFSTSMMGYSNRNADGTYNNEYKLIDTITVGNRAVSFTPTQNMYLAFVAFGSASTGDITLNNNDIKLMVAEGKFTAEQSEAAWIDEDNNVIIPEKAYDIYSDSPIMYGDMLRVYPHRKRAYRGNTDISAVQDWTQDLTLPEAEALLMTADTIVAPGDIELTYWSSRKNSDNS